MGKGKIERWFRTVRAQFLPVVAEDDAGTASLDALNRRLRVWIESEYHRTPHRGLEEGRTPLEQWALTCSGIRPAPPADELRRLFLLRRRRKVYNDRTVRLDGRVYEVGAELVGQRVELLVDPSAPPGTPLGVSWKGRDAGRATPVDRAASARRLPRRAASARPDRSGDSDGGDGSPAPAPAVRRVQLSKLGQPAAGTPDSETAAKETAAKETAA